MNVRESLSYEPVELSFGTSGLRGLVTDMTDLECYINTVGFLRFLQRSSLIGDGTVYVGGDLRASTPRIMAVVQAAISHCELTSVYCGLLPTPALAYYALQHNAPCIMVTGSHIPADRNGIKFYSSIGEVLKSDEQAMQKDVAIVRDEVYRSNANTSDFDPHGSLKQLPGLSNEDAGALKAYAARYIDFFDAQSFAGKKIVLYQHSAVGRDIIMQILQGLGAEVIPVERTDIFVPIDTENVGAAEKQLFKTFAQDYPEAFAIISTDGDSDRPFVIDEQGEFYRGDILGCIVADFLGAMFAAVPVSASDAVGLYCVDHKIELSYTKIGSPYVIAAMQQAPKNLQPVVSWEVNGGFLLGSTIEYEGKKLQPLPTRDALLPIICSLLAATRAHQQVSELFAQLPHRYTGAGLIDAVHEASIAKFRAMSGDLTSMQTLANEVFENSTMGAIADIDVTDGLKIRFASNDVLHFRPSGNAPQFRVYTIADSQARADELAYQSVAPDGHIAKLLQTLAQ